MSNLYNVTQQTIDMMAKATELAKSAQTTTGFTTVTGLTGYNLEAPSKKLFPVLAPMRNSIPRKKAPAGAPAANWKAITKINANNASATTGFGYAGALVSTATQTFTAKYAVIAQGESVQYDAEVQARGFEDLRATAGVNLLYSLMIEEDKLIKFGQAFSLGTPTAPTLTPSSSGGTIGAVNVDVAVAARTGQGWYTGNTTAASTATASGSLTGSTNSIAATVPYVRGAVCYDWYVGTHGGTLYYYGTTTVNKNTITFVPGSAQSVNPNDPTVNTVTPPPATAPGVDASGDPLAWNGLLASLTAHYDGNGSFVQYGTGVSPTGAYVKSLDGAVLTGNNGTINEIDAALAQLWVTAKLSPTKIRVNSLDHVNISNKIIASGGAYTLFRPNNVNERQNVVGGQLVDTYLNKYVNGRPIPIETDPWLMQGTIIIETAELPYPNNEVANVMEIEALLEYQQIEYAIARAAGSATGGPRYDFEVRAQQVFKNYFPGSMAVIQNVGNG